ncbi:hypothetical protein CHUAL_000210 [Chamberlinius hualienensis]
MKLLNLILLMVILVIGRRQLLVWTASQSTDKDDGIPDLGQPDPHEIGTTTTDTTSNTSNTVSSSTSGKDESNGNGNSTAPITTPFAPAKSKFEQNKRSGQKIFDKPYYNPQGSNYDEKQSTMTSYSSSSYQQQKYPQSYVTTYGQQTTYIPLTQSSYTLPSYTLPVQEQQYAYGNTQEPYGQTTQYGQLNTYSSPQYTYLQPSTYSNTQDTYGKTTQYGQPSSYSSPQDTYSQTTQQPNMASQVPYSSPQDTYSQTTQYGQTNSFSSPQDTFGKPNTYSNTQDTYGKTTQYGQPSPYSSPQDTYSHTAQYGQTNSYSSPQDTYGQPNPYGQPNTYSQLNSHGQPNSYGQIHIYGQPNTYSQQYSTHVLPCHFYYAMQFDRSGNSFQQHEPIYPSNGNGQAFSHGHAAPLITVDVGGEQPQTGTLLNIEALNSQERSGKDPQGRLENLIRVTANQHQPGQPGSLASIFVLPHKNSSNRPHSG